MNFKINPLIIIIFIFYIIGIVSLFFPMPIFIGIIFFIPAIIGTIVLYIRRIMRIYRQKNSENSISTESGIFEQNKIKLFEKIKPSEQTNLKEVKSEEQKPKELITIEQIKEISSQVKEVIDESNQCKKFISKIKLPVSSITTVNVQITPEVFLVITVNPDEIVVYKNESKIEEKKSEKTKVETKKREVKQSESVKVVEKQKSEPVVEKPKLTYQTIIEMVLKGKGKKNAADVLAECKKIKDLKQWDRLFPMANSRLGCPVIFSYTEEGGVKTKYAEWFESK